MVIDRYLLKELLVPFLIGVFALTLIFMLNQMVHLADLFVGRGLSPLALGRLLMVLVPPFLLLTLPAATLLAGIVVFARFSADHETVAFKAAGISFLRLMRPVALFAGSVAVVALAIGILIQPWGKGKLKELALETMRQHASIAITPGAFNNVMDELVIYAEKVSSGGQLTNIFISDDRDIQHPLLVTAQTGYLVSRPEDAYFGLLLTSGEAHLFSGDTFRRMRFSEYDLKVRLNLTQSNPLDVQSLGAEIRKRRAAGEPVDKLLQLLFDQSKNVTYSAACLIFGLLGPALGVHAVRSGRSGGFAAGIGLILVYYAAQTLMESMVVNERIGVTAGAWLPNMLFLAGTLYVWWRAQMEKPLLPALGRS